MTSRTLRSVLAIFFLTINGAFAATLVYDAGGFEAPTFTPGLLQGQDPVNGPWVRTPGTGSAVVQTTTVATGGQAVQLNRTGQDVRYGVSKPIDNVGLSSAPIVVVDWSMNYLAANLPPNSFGPYIGVEVYDDSGPTLLLAASAGVDATTSELLFQQPFTGFIDVVPGITVAPNSWHTYRLELNYSTLSYRLFFDGTAVLTRGFVDPGITDFTDFDIAALAGAGDPASQSAAGTGFFDNVLVTRVPEPGAPALAGIAALAVMRVRRRRPREGAR